MTKTYFIFLIVCVLFQSCWYTYYDDIDTGYENSTYEPVLWSRADLGHSIELLPAQQIFNSGKIYVIGDLLFVGEKYGGFHVFDNSNVQNPINAKFIKVLGSTDIAVRNNVLYINQATDLIALQYNFEEDNLKLVKRIENAFPDLRSPDGYMVFNIHQDSVIVGWKLKN